MKSIQSSTRDYETWLRAKIGPDFVEADLVEKHRKMRASAFGFLRATYWRWAEVILQVCPGMAGAAQVLAVGDTHLENFGTWRDGEGRLIWGVNDFDEADFMPWPLDLVRLATSALLASDRKDDHGAGPRDLCASILAGYGAGIANPRPFVLERDHKWLRETVKMPESERADFWAKIEAVVPGRPVPVAYRYALRAALPVEPEVIAPRSAGSGSLGRPRFLARAQWQGGPLLREAKAVVSSAWSVFGPAGSALGGPVRALALASGRFRAPDPHFAVAGGIALRRLSPNSRKIEVSTNASDLLSGKMLEAMGFEIANCHSDDPAVRASIMAELGAMSSDWLWRAAKDAAAAVAQDFRDFKG